MSIGSRVEVADETVLIAAIVWTIPTVLVLLFNALFSEIMQDIIAFSLFVLPTAILWVQVIADRYRPKGQRP